LRFVRAPGVEVERVIDGATAYRDDAQRNPERTKYAEGWLSGRRWEDDLRLIRTPAQRIGTGVTTIEDREREWRRAEGDA
jgi:hypothetical protein